MNLKNLILTSTVGMNREQWLEFRSPVNHVQKALIQIFLITNGLDCITSPADISEDSFFKPSINTYSVLKALFETQAWKDFVFPCVGASEIASIVGLNKYKSIIELYYEKVGLKPSYTEENAAMYWGKTLEETIANQWQYWEGSPETVFENFAKGKIVRKCRRMNAYVQNKDFPYLYCSLDRVINKYSGRGEGSLECKTISGYAADMWENGIPPMYVCQLQDQLMIFDFDFGEMAILRDGRTFQVYPFDKNEPICNRLKEEGKTFFQMVKAGIENYLLYKASGKQEYLALIDKYSPEPDGSTAYESYLKDTYNNEGGYEIFGGPVEVHLAKSYKHFDEKIKVIEEKQRECSNILKAFMKDAATIDLGAEGRVTWKANSKGTRVFQVRVKPEEDFVPNPELFKKPLQEPITQPEFEAPVVSMDFNKDVRTEPQFPVNMQTTEELPPGW